MKKLYSFLVLFFMLFFAYGQQTVEVPQGNPLGFRNRFPLSSSNGYVRTALLYSKQELGPNAGLITSVKFYLDTIGVPGTTPIKVYIIPTTDTVFTVASPYANVVGSAIPVFDSTLQGSDFTAQTWINLQLQTPVPYTGNQNLMVIVETNAGGTGSGEVTTSKQFAMHNIPFSKMQTWSANTNPPTTNGTIATLTRPNTQFVISSANSVDLSLSGFSTPIAPYSPGNSFVTINLSNTGNTVISSAQLNYQFNNGAIVTENFSGSLTPSTNGFYQFTSQITIPSTGNDTLKAWVSGVNGGGADAIPGNDTVKLYFCAGLPAGTYTVGSGGVYPTLKAAIDQMICGGISGSVTLSLLPGQYNEYIVIPPIPGSSNTNSITISPAQGANTVILSPDTALSKTNIEILGADYITFSDIVFKKGFFGTATQYCVRTRFSSDYISFLNCTFSGDSTNITSTANKVLSINNANNNTVSGCTFKNTGLGVEIIGNSLINGLNSNNTVLNNVFTNTYAGSMNITNQVNLMFDGNVFTGGVGTSTTANVFAFNKIVSSTIRNNVVKGDIWFNGFSITDFDGNAQTPNLFYNNVVGGVFKSTTARALTLTASQSQTTNPINPKDYIEVVNNSFNVGYTTTSTTTISYGIVNITGGSNLLPALEGMVFKNNSVVARPANGTTSITGAARAIVFANDSLAAIPSINNNNYYLIGGNTNFIRIGTTGTADFGSIAAWTAVYGKDANSYNGDPGYLGLSNLFPSGNTLNDHGSPISYVTTDILNVTRNITTPDIGAYEFTPSPTDVWNLGIVGPKTGCGLSASDTVKVRVFNNGTLTVTNYTLKYQVNGGALQSMVVPGPLLPGDTVVISHSIPVNLSTPGNYTITAITNATGDLVPLNDTTSSLVISIPVISTLPYTQNFENGNGGWVSGGAFSSWALGTPNKAVINSAAPNGTNSFVTSLTGTYNASERSYVESPCFNLSAYPRPKIKMNVWWNCQNNSDGAVIQYSIDGGNTWNALGTANDPRGVNWYNNAAMAGGTAAGSVNSYLSNGGTYAWNGTGTNSSGGWVVVERPMPEVGGQSAVKFRVAFAADAFTQQDGFAFDNIEITQPLNPVIQSVTQLSDTCSIMPRIVKATVTYVNPLTSVSILYNLAGSATGPFSTSPMTLTGTEWTGTIPGGTSATRVYYRVVALDGSGLTDTSLQYHYTDDYLVVNAGVDQTIPAGQSVTLGISDPSGLVISELMFNRGGTGTQTTFPAGVPTTGVADMVEITNTSNSSINLAGKRLVALNATTTFYNYELPSVALGAGQVLVVVGGTGTDDPTNRVYFAGNATADFTSSGSSTGFYIRDTVNNSTIDAVYYGNLTWPATSPVTSADFSGNVGSTSGFSGIQRFGSDNNTAANWRINGANLNSTILSINSNLTLSTLSYSWYTTTNSTVLSTNSQLTVSPTVTTSYVLSATDGRCTKNDTVVITVSGTSSDVGVSRIISPAIAVPASSNQVVKVVIRNYAQTAISGVPVAYSINGGAPVSEVFSGNINPGDSVQYTFTSVWSVPSTGPFVLRAFTQASGDINRTNDTTRNNLVIANTDMSVRRILTPLSGSVVNTAQPITVVLRNMGNTPVSNFDVAYSVNGTPRATQTVTNTLNPGDSTTFSFTNQWTPTAGGVYTIRAYITGLAADANKLNDTARVVVSSTVAVQELGKTTSIVVYPNPTSQVVFLEGSGLENAQKIQIVDLTGRVLFDERIQNLNTDGKRFEVSVSQFVGGMYQILVYKNSTVEAKPLIIQR